MALHQKILFLLLVLMPAQIGYHYWPEWAHVAGRRIDYLSPTLYLTDLLILLLLTIWLAGRALRRPVLSPKAVHLPALIAFVFFVFVNIRFAIEPGAALYTWVKVLEFVGLGWYLYVTRPPLSFFRFPLALGVAYSSILAIWQFGIQHSVGGVFWWLGERTFTVGTPNIARLDWCISLAEGCRTLLRPYASFPHPNVLGGYLAVMTPVLIGAVSDARLSGRFRVFYTSTVLLGLAALVTTFSRSAWIAAAFGVVSAIYFVTKNGKSRKLMYGLGILGVLAALLFFAAVINRPLVSDRSVVERARLNKASISLWKSSPVIGIGLGNFIPRLPESGFFRQSPLLQPVHNIYLLVLSEAGIVGLLLFLMIIGTSIRRNRSILYKNSAILASTDRIFFGISFALLLMLGIVDHYPLTLQQGQIFLVVLMMTNLMHAS